MHRLIRQPTLSLSILIMSHLLACSESPPLPTTTEARSSAGQTTTDTATAGDVTDPTPESMTPDNTAQTTTPGPTTGPVSPSPIGTTPASGTSAISFTPVRYPAAQYPAFVYAIWVTDANNKYIRTLSARAATRMRYLDKWLTSAGVVAPTQPDGVAGASINFPATPAPIAITWDMKDKAGAFIPQGNYTINIQMTSSNNTGVSLTIPVTINATGMMKTDTSMTTGITAVSAKHTP